MEFLKKIFGDKTMTFEDFKSAVTADTSIKLINLADGGYVSKEKFDDKDNALKTANETIKQLQSEDVEKMKQTIADYEKKEQQRADAEKAANELQALKERFAPLKGEHTFLNEGTENWIFEEFKKAIALEENKGKSDADIFGAITKDKNIYENPNQKFVNPPAGGGNVNDDDAKARAVMGLPPIKE